tara:strand:- start:1950 stop:2213 length:264 start_codon:yes stop_codon:yes gene_type:complete
MTGKCSLSLSGFHIPDPDRFVEAAAGQRLTAWVPVQAGCRTRVATQCLIGSVNNSGSSDTMDGDNYQVANAGQSMIRLHRRISFVGS